MFLLPDDALHSQAPALYDASQERWWSYRDLANTVQQASEAFRATSKSLIFLFTQNSAACVIAYLSAVESGHAVALLDEGLAEDFKTRLLEIYRPEFVVGTTPLTGFENTEDVSLPVLEVGRRPVEQPHPIHRDLALLLSTSGTTGTPKFVRLTRRNVESNAASIQAGLAIGPEERAITSLAIHYSYGLSVLNSHLRAGASIRLTDAGLMSSSFWDLFRAERCTSLAGVPYSYQILRRLDLDKLNVPSLRTLTQAGGRLQNDLISHFHSRMEQRGGRFFVMYGQTEATARMAILPHNMLPEKLGSAGKAIQHGAFETDGNEVVYRGPNVMMGYAASREDLSRGDELGSVLKTGDTGYLDPDGYLYLTGRRKRDAKILGLRINMDEVEQILRDHGPVAVIAGNEKLIVYSENGDQTRFSEYARELTSHLRLNAGAVEFRYTSRLPVKANGKVDYAALEERR
jgi:acyl-coenzyme A synthetase/AMP-(fatty) acid ligase